MVLVDEVGLTGLHIPPTLIYSTLVLVSEVARALPNYLRLSILIIKVAHQRVSVEIMFLDAKRCG